MREAWELSLAEIDAEIEVTQKLLNGGQGTKFLVDHMMMLQGQREERLIEEEYS